MPYRMVVEGVGWAGGIASALLAVLGGGIPDAIPGAEYASELGIGGVLLFLLWRGAEKFFAGAVTHGKAAGRALLDFLAQKDEKDRIALDAVRESLDKLGRLTAESAREGREQRLMIADLVRQHPRPPARRRSTKKDDDA